MLSLTDMVSAVAYAALTSSGSAHLTTKTAAVPFGLGLARLPPVTWEKR